MKRTKIVFIFLLSLFTAGFLTAQTNFIPKAGLNFSYFSGELASPDDEVKGKTGYHVGFSVRFGEQFYFEPGVQYLKRNARLKRIGSVDVSELDIDFEIEGVRIPLYIGGDVLKGDRIGLRLFGGPTYMHVFKEDQAFEPVEEYLLRNSLWSLNAGAGVDLGIFTLEVEHEWGLTNVFKTDGIESKNSVVYLTAGLLF